MKDSTHFQNKTSFVKLKTLFWITTLICSTLMLFPNQAKTQKITHDRGTEFEDPDHLGRPVYIGKVAPLTVPPYTPYSLQRSGYIGLKSATSELDPGEVAIEKTAEPTGTNGRWKINLQVEGKSISQTTDIVLVIDDSGSMSGSKIADVKDAANDFVDSILIGSTGIQIAVVTINGGGGTGQPETDQNFTSNRTLLHNAINDISASGGTNLHGGFYLAQTLLLSSTAENKAVVLMSDGEPTYSYDCDVTSSVTPYVVSCRPFWPYTATWSHTREEIEDNYLSVTPSSVDYTDVNGSGSNFSYTLYSVEDNCGGRTYTFDGGHHGIPTIYEAGLLIDMGVMVYTIGFDIDAGGDAEKVLLESQNKGYYPANSSNLNDIYQEIGANILFAATNAVLTDPMSTYVVLETANPTPSYSVLPDVSGDVVISQGSVSFINNGCVLNDPDDSGSGCSSIIKWLIEWDFGTVSELDPAIMYYYVNMAPNVTPATDYPANEQTYLDYTDAWDNPAYQQTNDDFTVPVVNLGCALIISCPSTFETTAQCVAPAAAADSAALTDLGVVFTDQCGTIVISYDDSSNGQSCPETITRTYTIYDYVAGVPTDSATCIQTITIDDTTDPVVVAPDDFTLEGCGTDAITGWAYSETKTIITVSYADSLSVTEACGVDSVYYVDSQSGTCPVVITRTFTVVDNCGNTGTDSQTINIDDTTDPVVV
ncbi:MAG: VWA domain-containing protein, partial [Bacteroidales bacterium]|nr:VWA domain-containing protein [Bacteroidales bacterium]